MQARVSDEVAIAGGGNGGDVTDVLDHGGKRQRNDGDHRGQQHVAVEVVTAEQTENGRFQVDGQREPLGLSDILHERSAHSGVSDHGDHIRADDAQQDGNDFDHALAPDVGGDNDDDGDQRDPPVVGAVVDGGGRQVQADGDDDGAGDDGREEAHDLAGAEDLEQGGKNDIHKTGAGHAEAGVGQKLGVGGGAVDHRGDGEVAAEEGE